MNDPRDLYQRQEELAYDPRDLYQKNSISNEMNAKGWTGVGQDIGQSLSSLPNAITEMLMALPGEAYASGEQIVNNPSRAASNIAGGAVKSVRGLGNIPHNIREYLLEKEIPFSSNNPYPQFEPSSIENYLLEGTEPGDPLLRGGGEFLVPYSRIGAGVKGVKGVAQRTGALGTMAVANGEMDPIHAAITGMLGEGIGKGAKISSEYLAKNRPFQGAGQKVVKGIELDDVAQTVDAAKRLGLDYITPGEASGFGYIGKQEGKIGNTLEGSKIREKKAKSRAESEENVINDFLYKLDDKVELPKEKQALYNSVKNEIMPDNFLANYITENSTVQTAIKHLESKPAYKDRLKGVPKNSFEYWNEIKKVLYDMESSEKRAGRINLGDAVGDVRRELVQTMDNIDPRYQTARKLSQRSILRREIEEGFDKKDMTGKNFYKNVLQSKKSFEKLYNDLSEFPDLQQRLLDMRLVFPKLYGQSNAIGAAHGERGGYATPRNIAEWTARYLKQKFNEKGDIRAVQAITSPSWVETMKGNEIIAPGQRYTAPIDPIIENLIKASLAGQDNE